MCRERFFNGFKKGLRVCKLGLLQVHIHLLSDSLFPSLPADLNDTCVVAEIHSEGRRQVVQSSDFIVGKVNGLKSRSQMRWPLNLFDTIHLGIYQINPGDRAMKATVGSANGRNRSAQ